MKRAVERYLGRPAVNRPIVEAEAQPLETVVFAVSVRRMLTRQLEVKGQWQGGALFGELALGTLTVRFVTPLGPPGWLSQPLQPHLPYLIGWTDSVEAQFGAALDWCGNWIAAPDSRLPDERADLSWLRLGAKQGLFDDTHPLVIVGMDDGRLLGRAYSWNEDCPVALRGANGHSDGFVRCNRTQEELRIERVYTEILCCIMCNIIKPTGVLAGIWMKCVRALMGFATGSGELWTSTDSCSTSCSNGAGMPRLRRPS